ncbi:hypothetical protein [Elioraea sp.]|uniref:phage tail tube protein n=1 Tax=Elioraea sp. TaxID=2185103 RepID=UPI0025C0B107|nr:hypothetical protein [Elioraea sp.]
MSNEISQGAQLFIRDLGNAWVQIQKAGTISGLGGGQAAVQDVTSLDSAAKEFRSGLRDEGEVSVALVIRQLADPGQIEAMRARNAQRVARFRITSLLDPTLDVQFDALVLAVSLNFEVDNPRTGELTLRVTGPISGVGA